MAPKVSAIVSTYNAERFIERCLANLLRQTLADSLEIVIINSGSNQDEERLVQPFCRRFPQIKYVKTARETLYGAWNRAVGLATGEYLISANTDDLSYPDAFSQMAALLDAHPQQALVYTGYYVTTIADDDVVHPPPGHWHRIKAPAYSHKELLLNCFCGPRPMWRRSLHQQLGYFDDSLYYAGDYEFWLRIAEKHSMLAHNTALHLYLENPQGLWNTLRGNGEELEIRKKYLSTPQ